MKYGVYQFSTDYAMRADDLARAVEGRGFESLFVPEHTHIPARRKSPWPGGPNLPREYGHTLDPFVSLAAAAAVTSRLKLETTRSIRGTGDQGRVNWTTSTIYGGPSRSFTAAGRGRP